MDEEVMVNTANAEPRQIEEVKPRPKCQRTILWTLQNQGKFFITRVKLLVQSLMKTNNNNGPLSSTPNPVPLWHKQRGTCLMTWQ